MNFAANVAKIQLLDFNKIRIQSLPLRCLKIDYYKTMIRLSQSSDSNVIENFWKILDK